MITGEMIYASYLKHTGQQEPAWKDINQAMYNAVAKDLNEQQAQHPLMTFYANLAPLQSGLEKLLTSVKDLSRMAFEQAVSRLIELGYEDVTEKQFYRSKMDLKVFDSPAGFLHFCQSEQDVLELLQEVECEQFQERHNTQPLEAEHGHIG